MKSYKVFVVALPFLLLPAAIQAHDPVFGIGPHVLFKDGIELHLGGHQDKAGDERVTEAEMELKYGITGDWVAGFGVPYVRAATQEDTDSGLGPINLSTKYRFWRKDMPGAQEATAVMGRVIFANGDIGHGHAKRQGNDYLLGFTYGYEGRKWYRWASVRRRFNNDAANGAERPDVWLVDLVGGIRPTPTEYLEPDWVWMLELNGEIIEHVSNLIDGTPHRAGGNQWFVSPGLMWTYRNVAVKTGVQFPVYDDLARGQEPDDYRALIEFEWHL